MDEPLLHEQVLLDIGIGKNDARVYLALLRKKTATVVELAEQSTVHRVNVYDALKNLRKLGLVTELQVENKRLFSATNPKNIFNIIKEKEVKVNSILPALEMHYALQQKTCDIQIYETQNAIRKQFVRFVERNAPIYYWGIPKVVLSLIGKDFQEEIHKRRGQQKQWMYHIYNSDAAERSKYLNTLPYTKSRMFSASYDSPVATAVCGDELILNLVNDEKVITVSIMNKALAKAYESYFWILWDKAEEES
ncbi:MAG: helix-turn-helix domain-containing protein [Nanoarchaeota archaeon]